MNVPAKAEPVEVEQEDSGSAKQLVVFQLAAETYGIDIHQVREIIRLPSITKVPRTPPFLEGVINLRGGVIPVIHLRKRFSLGENESEDDSRIIVVELEDQTVGIIVDAVSEVLEINTQSIEPLSSYVVSVDTTYIPGIVKLADRLVIVLDVTKVLSPEEHASITELSQGAGTG